MKKKFMENSKFRLIVMALITVVIVTGFSFAWFIMKTTDVNQNFSVANFQAKPVCTFMSDGVKVDPSEIEGATDGNLIVLSTEPTAQNYIGKFCVDVNYKGDGAGYLRVKMVHEYSIPNGEKNISTQHSANVPYKTVGGTEKWADNRGNDYCYYYTSELDADGDEEKTLEFITYNDEIDVSNLADGVEIRVAVETDMVQVNRYPQIWGITELPW